MTALIILQLVDVFYYQRNKRRYRNYLRRYTFFFLFRTNVVRTVTHRIEPILLSNYRFRNADNWTQLMFGIIRVRFDLNNRIRITYPGRNDRRMTSQMCIAFIIKLSCVIAVL